MRCSRGAIYYSSLLPCAVVGLGRLTSRRKQKDTPHYCLSASALWWGTESPYFIPRLFWFRKAGWFWLVLHLTLSDAMRIWFSMKIWSCCRYCAPDSRKDTQEGSGSCGSFWVKLCFHACEMCVRVYTHVVCIHVYMLLLLGVKSERCYPPLDGRSKF